MHETGIVRDLVRRVDQAAKRAGALRVTGITVWLGALSQFSAPHFREHFNEDAKGTLAEHAKLTIETSSDATDPNALHVMLRDIELEVEESA